MHGTKSETAVKSDFSAWYQDHYHELCGGGVWLRGGELNTLSPEDYERRPYRVLFARLSSYFDTRESFTQRLLYQIAAAVDGVFPDLSYLPLKQDAAVFKRDSVPWMIGTQSRRGPAAFDLIGISNSILLELLNLPALLINSGIPLYKSERLDNQSLPLIILGGANALHSSVFWNERTILDGIFIGEDPGTIQRLLQICRTGKAAGLSKREVLESLTQIPGFLEPERSSQTRRAWSADFNGGLNLSGGPTPFSADTAGRGQIQISEGCPCFCSFCAEGWQRKPYREKSTAELIATAREQKARLGLSEIDLYSFNFNQHGEIYQLLWELTGLFNRLGLKSQRFDLLAQEPRFVEILHLLDKSSLTCGLEGVSPRLRRYLHKNLEPGDLHTALTAIFRSRARELKIFLIATGLEQEEDFKEFGAFVAALGKMREAAHAGTRIIFSITPLVRFPATPLEFEHACAPESFTPILQRLKNSAEEGGFEFRAAATGSEYLLSQLLARGSGAELSEALVELLRLTGFVYYREIGAGFAEQLKSVLRGRGLELEALLNPVRAETVESAPWTRVDLDVKRDFLREQFKRAAGFSEIDYCLGQSGRAGKCAYCGACPGAEDIKRMTAPRTPAAGSVEAFRERIKADQKDRRVVPLLVELHERTRGLPRASVAAAIARSLMLADRNLIDGYRRFVGSSFEPLDGAPWVWGREQYGLEWQTAAYERLQTQLASPEWLSACNAEFAALGRIVGTADREWTPAAFVFKSPFSFRPDDFLKKRGLKYTLRKSSAGNFQYDLNRESLKKGILKRLEGTQGAGQSEVHVIPGSKFNFQDFMRESFQARPASAWVRTLVQSS